MKFNFRKIASALASTAIVGSTVALAAAASWPMPFVKNGAADVAIVYGNSPDLTTVTDITTALSSHVTSSGGSSGVPEGGDFVQLHKSSDELNLGDAWTIIGTNLDDGDLPNILADGVYSTDENEDHDYTQKIALGANTLTHFADTDYNDEEPTLGFQIASSAHVFNYTLDFKSLPESDVVGGDLVDFETTYLTLLGKRYYVLDFDNSTLDITLLDAADSATVSEGETITVEAGGKSYQVSIGFVGSDEVKLIVNGVQTNTLAERETQKLGDGSYLGIQDILVQDYAGGVKQVEFSIGSGKLLIDNGATIELNDDNVDEITGYVNRGSASGGRERLDSIVLQWNTDDEVFLTPSEDLMMPGFESVKFSMNDFVTPFTEEVKIRVDSDNVQLTLPLDDGEASFGLLYVDATGNFTGFGESSSKILVTSNSSTLIFNETANHEYFVASWESSTDSESYLLRAKSFRHDSETGANTTIIENMVTGDEEEVETGDDYDIGSVSLTVTQVFDSGDNEWVTLSAGSGVSFNKVYTAEGLRIYLPYLAANGETTTAKGAIATSFNGTNAAGHTGDSFYLFMDEEDEDDTIAVGTSFNFTLNDNSDKEPQVSQVNNVGTGGSTGKEIGDSNVYEAYIVSSLATRILHDTDGDRDFATVEYHGGESYAEVFVTETGTTTSGSTGSLGNIAVMDSELESSGMQAKNLIVVGGSCINTAAQTLLGLTEAACGSAWTSATGAGAGEWVVRTYDNPWDTGSKIATLVAGYDQSDTAAAATALKTQSTIDIASGKNYKGGVANANVPVLQ